MRHDLNDVAIRERVAQRHHFAVHLRARALVAYFGVHGIGEVDRRGATRQHHHAAFWRECVDLFGIQVDAQGRKEFARLLHLLHPLDQMAHPDDALIVRGSRRRLAAAILVFPVRSHALLGDAVHLLRANLYLKRLAGMNHGRVQGLIQIRARHGDVVLEPARHRPPDLMDHAERAVAVLHRVGDHADRQQIVNLIEIALLLLDFLVQRIEALHAALDFGGDSVLDHFAANRVLHFEKEFVEDFLLRRDFLLQLEKRLGLEIAERQILELAADQAHAETVRDGRVDIERLARDALLALGREEFERAHVVQAVAELHHHHANVVDHREQHLADVFRLAIFRGEQIELADLGDAFDQPRDIRTERFRDFLERDFRVFDHIVQQRGADRGHVELHVREEMRHFERMREVRLARKAELRLVLLGREIVGAAQQVDVVAGAVLADLVREFDEAQIDGAPRANAHGGFPGRVHDLYYSALPLRADHFGRLADPS